MFTLKIYFLDRFGLGYITTTIFRKASCPVLDSFSVYEDKLISKSFLDNIRVSRRRIEPGITKKVGNCIYPDTTFSLLKR